MHRVISFLLPLLFLCSCKEEPVAPDIVANEFLTAYHGRNFSQASQYIAPDHEAQWLAFVQYQENFPDSIPGQFTIDTISMAEDGDMAVVRYHTGSDSILHQVNLRRWRDTWQVLFETNDPQSVARTFLEAFNKGDFVAARHLVTANARRDFDMIVKKGGASGDLPVHVNKVVLSKGLDKAVVYYTEGQKDAVKKINLRKEQGLWRVTFQKMDNFEPLMSD